MSISEPRQQRVLAIGAHPDDIEILCAGTLARCHARGDQIILCVATNGDMGSMTHMPPELAQIRRREAEKSASLLDAEFHWLDFPDEFLYHDHDTRMRFIEMIRAARPDIILTHSPDDYHTDHRIVSELVFVSSFIAAVPHVQTDSAVHAQIAPIYYFDTLAGVNFLPTEYVDISETLEKKLQMMRCHESQLEWLGKYNGIDILEFITSVARFRGLQSGVHYAEGFRRADVWPRTGTVRHLP
jgi:LmbE family N-acetylglucosaminyl deacetylase